MSTYREILQAGQQYLKKHEIADADVDAWYLLAHVFGIDRAKFFMQETETVPEHSYKQYDELLQKRASHIPLQHITGSQEFMGLEFFVDENVLIPRQDTECLVEEVLKVSSQKEVLDLCTGSGCIIISIAKLGDIKRGIGVDVSESALEVASKNAIKHNVDVTFIKSDLFKEVEGQFDIIVSNPPYIPTEDIKSLMPEVKNHEPMLALDGSEDGLLFYRLIITALKEHLKKDGLIFFEIGYNQGMDIKVLLQKEGFCDIQIKKDYSGHDRVIHGKRS